MRFVGSYKYALEKEKRVNESLSRFIESINTSGIEVKNDDSSQNPLELKNSFDLEKWSKTVDNQIIFKPILLFPYSNQRIDTEKRKIPVEFEFKQSYDFEYEITIPDGYKLEFKPENYEFSNDLLFAKITYTQNNNKLLINQKIKMNTLLIERSQFTDWNTAVKNITKQYNQNIILSKS